MIEKGKMIDEFATPYLYEALVFRDKKDFTRALHSLNTYLSMGGAETKEISEFKENLKNINNYEKGVQLIYESPNDALKILIPLVDIYGDTAEIFYYIAIAYRNLGIHEKAIYYLNEASAVDSALIEVLNEYGFSRVDFVHEPGQFAVRGSIIDIFSYSNDFPYRIDFFDDEVELIFSTTK